MSEPDDRSPADDTNGQAPTDEAPASEEAPPEDPLAEAKAEAARFRDQLLRTAADFDNFRKRSRRELEDAFARGRDSAVKDLLPVFDNLERATSHAGDASDAKALAEGLRIVLKQFADTLEKMGVSRVSTVGSPFDPSVHEAIQQIPSTEHPAGVIVAEVQAGYRAGKNLIRAAMVVVSRGAPEA
jgi:molecular chaperone GrpE